MNYTITPNPYVNDQMVVTTRGVMTDAKVAKLNNDKKKPALVRHWEELRPEVEMASPTPELPKDYSVLLNTIGITPVNYGKVVTNSGAKKLRVNKIVNEKAKNIYNNSPKVDVVATPIVTEEIKEEVKPSDNFMPNNIDSLIDNHGRHASPTPVVEMPEKVTSEPLTPPVYATRSERNTVVETNRVEAKPEAKAGDMDLYNNLLHSVGSTDDVSRQLQGARNQLTFEKEENRKLAEQYGEAVKELAKLKEDIEVTKKQKEQKVKEELSITLKNIENLQKENLERTSDLTSIQSEIARLKAEKQAIEASGFE